MCFQEDAFLIAADVFSSTELPSLRVGWLEKLAEFHRMRGRFAEEATCRCCIYHTYREAAKQHDHIWSSSAFIPWASSNSSDLGGEGHAIISDFDFEIENSSGGSGKQTDRGTAFRRIFYRAADSVRVRSGDWGAVSGGKYLFCGVTLKSEFDSVSPWYSHRCVYIGTLLACRLSFPNNPHFLNNTCVEPITEKWKKTWFNKPKYQVICI